MLARAAPLLVWGGLHVSSTALRTGLNAALDELKVKYGHGLAGQPILGVPEEEAVSNILDNLNGKWNVAKAILLVRGEILRGKIDFLLASVYANGRRCSDPRDAVFALYGFDPKLQKAYPPDYNKPVQQVMHDTAVYLACTGNLSDVYS